VLLDLQNDRYNPEGASIDDDFRFPLATGEFDIIYLFSVFTHMIAEDIKIYLREFERLLRPTGKIFLTAFIKDGVPTMSINPPGYAIPWSGPLHCVQYDRRCFEQMLASNGFLVDKYGAEIDEQTSVRISRGTDQVCRVSFDGSYEYRTL
jgi:SAM-dependent methyltransferase